MSSGGIIYISDMWQLAQQGELKGVWFFCGLYFFILGLYSVFYQIKTRFWPVVQGVVIKVEAESFGGKDLVRSEQMYTSNAKYKYNVSGVEYEGSRVSPWVFVISFNLKILITMQLSRIEYFPDGRLKVFYNPKNPNKSFLIIASKAGIFITFLIATLPIILFYLKFYS